MKPVWLQTWRASLGDVWRGDDLVLEGVPGEKGAALAAAVAPEAVRALLKLEWEGARRDHIVKVCPACGAYPAPHYPACWLDALLSKVGFRTAQAREDARKRIALEEKRAEAQRRDGDGGEAG